MDIRTHIDSKGKILIPSSLRKKHHIIEGDTFVLRIVNNEIRLIPINTLLKKARNVMAKYLPEETSLVEECINIRRNEAKKEKS